MRSTITLVRNPWKRNGFPVHAEVLNAPAVNGTLTALAPRQGAGRWINLVSQPIATPPDRNGGTAIARPSARHAAGKEGDFYRKGTKAHAHYRTGTGFA